MENEEYQKNKEVFLRFKEFSAANPDYEKHFEELVAKRILAEEQANKIAELSKENN